jgi:heat shock protein HslJ
MKLKFIFPLAAFFLLITQSCAGTKVAAEKTEKTGSSAFTSPEIVGKHWKLVELNGAPVNSTSSLTEAYLVFNADGRISGSLSCNSFSGTYKTENGNRLKIDSLVSTRKMCLDMSVEDELQRVLTIADQFSITGNRLVLSRARMAPLAVFEMASPQ